MEEPLVLFLRKEISEAAKKQLNLEIDKKKLQLPSPIRNTWRYQCSGAPSSKGNRKPESMGKRGAVSISMEEALIKRILPHSIEAEQSVDWRHDPGQGCDPGCL